MEFKTKEEYLRWYSAEIQKGIDDVEAGRVISHEELGRKLKEEFGIDIDGDPPAIEDFEEALRRFEPPED
ncbi:hypothetical protein [Desulfovibrio sp. JC010]|uniref:hypothetical protein n=1 Tax=Desulfovibrio sp. JC010 TaxID=2593641 RepID=UPI00193F90D1|nr:hypothetical protein [Desulfovibrio sp. JC010]